MSMRAVMIYCALVPGLLFCSVRLGFAGQNPAASGSAQTAATARASSATPPANAAGLSPSPSPKPDADALRKAAPGLRALFGLPYRDDGALDEYGRYTLLARPDVFFDEPGLNCSGYVLAAARSLLGGNLTIAQAKRDRLGDSGPGAALGQDWDYGFDLILNLSEGFERRVLTPDGPIPVPDDANGVSLRGFPLEDRTAWTKILGHIRPDRVYLASISKPVARKGYTLLHYHVAVLVPDGKGGAWWSHSTPNSGVHRMDLASPEGMSLFRQEFSSGRLSPKKVLLLEVDPTSNRP